MTLPTDRILNDDGTPSEYTEADFGCIAADVWIEPAPHVRAEHDDDPNEGEWDWSAAGPEIPAELRAPMPAQRRTMRGVLRGAVRQAVSS